MTTPKLLSAERLTSMRAFHEPNAEVDEDSERVLALLDHIAALEKALGGDPREWPTPAYARSTVRTLVALLGPEAAGVEGDKNIVKRVERLRKERAALEADLDAHKVANEMASCVFCEWRQAVPGGRAARKAMLAEHVTICRSHPMRALEADNAALLNAINEANAVGATAHLTAVALLQKHPGAALLEEHRKALVRARNEGMDKAARTVFSECDGTAPGGCDCDACCIGRDILSLKEPE